jgi:hypothetical protein
MDDTQTKESLFLTIRELGRQNEMLQRKYEAMLKLPKGQRVITACLGFNPQSATTKGMHAVFVSQPQLIFRPERFCVSRECASHFLICDLKVGMKSQFVSSESIPAKFFAVDNLHRYREIEMDEDFDTPLPHMFDTALPGMWVQAIVRRIDDSTVPFECLMVGATLDTNKEELPEGPITLPKKELPPKTEN